MSFNYRAPKIVQYSPTNFWMIVFLIIVIICVSAGYSYTLGLKQGGWNKNVTVQEIEKLRQLTTSKDSLIEDLNKKLIIAQQDSKVDKETLNEMINQTETVRRDFAILKKELAFYQGIISPKTTEIGLHIHSLKIFALPEKRTFQYKLMLTQAQKKVKTAIGKVLLSIDGMQGSKPVILKMSTFSKEYAGGHVYKFKYFQKFEGIIKLPENYVSKIVSVTLKPKYGKKVVKKEFDWPIK